MAVDLADIPAVGRFLVFVGQKAGVLRRIHQIHHARVAVGDKLDIDLLAELLKPIRLLVVPDQLDRDKNFVRLRLGRDLDARQIRKAIVERIIPLPARAEQIAEGIALHRLERHADSVIVDRSFFARLIIIAVADTDRLVILKTRPT